MNGEGIKLMWSWGHGGTCTVQAVLRIWGILCMKGEATEGL